MNTENFNPHVTVACVVERNKRFLMVEELINGEIRFNQPAGHLEHGESLVDAGVRETLEETAWQIEITHFLGVCVFEAGNGETYIRNTFVGQPVQHYPNRTLDDGIIGAHWMTRAEIAAKSELLRSPMILATIDQYLSGECWPLALVSYHR